MSGKQRQAHNGYLQMLPSFPKLNSELDVQVKDLNHGFRSFYYLFPDELAIKSALLVGQWIF